MDVSALEDGACVRVPLSMLVDAPWGNVRKGKRDKRSYEDLKASIAQRGVTQAITVRPNDADDTLETLAGYGRREASREIGCADIPAVIKRVDDREAYAIGLSENLDREDLSITDEIRMAQQFVSLYDADYAEAAKAIGWDERRLRGRLKLNDCTEAALDALAEGRLRIGHAEVLCQFTEKLQNNTLEKILSEQWTVEYLKERANKASRVLRHARFDTTECNTCPHNSSVQASLFDNSIGTGKCGHLPCYREKTEAWLGNRKAALEQEHGVVLLAVEKPESDRRTVSPDVVGEDAYTEDCLSCASRIRVLQDGINKDCGTVIDNQCIKLSCFRAKVEAKEAAERPDTVSGNGRSGQSTRNRKAQATKKPGSSPTLAGGVRAQAEAFVRQVVGTALLEDEHYRLAMTLAALARMTGYTPEKGSLPNIPELAQWDGERLEKAIREALADGTLSAGVGTFDGTRVVIGARRLVSDAKAKVVAAWQPSEEWLQTYQKGGIESFCRQKAVGFASAFDAEKGKGAFDKLMKQRKDVVIDTILGFDFDWSGAAPKEVIDLVG